MANPLTLLGVTGLLVAPSGLGRLWWGIPQRGRKVVLVAALGSAWLWQLGRFGFLPG
jgi:hypothetical protein